MATELYAITGATGNIGSKTVRALLKQGKKVRAIARTVDKLAGLQQAGAETVAASLDDIEAVTRAFNGATAVFAMIPPNYTAQDFRAYQNKLGDALAQAITRSGIQYVVNLSSVGAQHSDKVGPINGIYDQEQRLNRLKDVHVLHLRPSFFMENVLMNIGVIKGMGLNGTPLKAEAPMPMIATQDIAAEVARHLVARDFTGKVVRELLGPRDLTMNEVTRVLGRAIGKPDLKYVQFPYEDAEKAMIQMGLSPDVARLFIEMQRGMNDGLIRPTQPRGPETSTPTPIEEFAKTFAQAYQAN
jgi:uncharacterized protein YbjT (DUF2867 family)